MFPNHIPLHGEKGTHGMKKAIVVDASDIKKILAERFGVSEEQVYKSQYSWTVVTDKEDENE